MKKKIRKRQWDPEKEAETVLVRVTPNHYVGFSIYEGIDEEGKPSWKSVSVSGKNIGEKNELGNTVAKWLADEIWIPERVAIELTDGVKDPMVEEIATRTPEQAEKDIDPRVTLKRRRERKALQTEDEKYAAEEVEAA